jgi:hypothetical protein
MPKISARLVWKSILKVTQKKGALILFINSDFVFSLLSATTTHTNA